MRVLDIIYLILLKKWAKDKENFNRREGDIVDAYSDESLLEQNKKPNFDDSFKTDTTWSTGYLKSQKTLGSIKSEEKTKKPAINGVKSTKESTTSFGTDKPIVKK